MEENTIPSAADHVANYLQGVLEDRTVVNLQPDGQPADYMGAGHLAPTLWADAPWRLEPDYKEIPFTFIVRDAEKDDVDMRLTAIEVWEAEDDGTPWNDKSWQLVHRFTDGLDGISDKYWTYRPVPSIPLGPPPSISLAEFQTAVRGKQLHVKIDFKGSQAGSQGNRENFIISRALSILLAETSLPMRQSPQWSYGDTHYHSNYTNDVKEYGNPVPDTRAAAEAIGLDWLIVTDHSVDLDDGNPYWEQKLTASRWDDLGLEVRENSDDRFRLMRGEEVTLLGKAGKGDETLHMLAFR